MSHNKPLVDIESLDASIAEGDELDKWKERCWQAEKESAKYMAMAERFLARAAYLEEKWQEAINRVAELEAQVAKRPPP